MRSILVMEEEEAIRRLIRKILIGQGYEIACAKDGTEAIGIYKNALNSGAPFDAVILDMTVSYGMGGVDAIQKLIELDPEVKGIIFSGYPHEDPVCNYQKYGFCGALTKPFSKGELIRLLDQVAES